LTISNIILGEMMIFKESVEKKIPLNLHYLRSTTFKKLETIDGFGGVFFTFPTITAIESAIANDIVGTIIYHE